MYGDVDLRLGAFTAGNDSGSNCRLGASIDGTSPVPPASAEDAQTKFLDPTVQRSYPLIRILAGRNVDG
jgi:hypothetical protein